MKNTGINESITKLLNLKLNAHKDKGLNKETCIKIYQDIFDTLVETMSEARVEISNESMNYLAQQYYDAVTITNNGVRYELDPNIFDQRAKLENVETKEIALLATMMKGTDFAVPMLIEIKKRS